MLITRIQPYNYPNKNIQPTFAGKNAGYILFQMQDYINGKIKCTPKTCNEFEGLLNRGELDFRDVKSTAGEKFFDFIAQNLHNPFNARLLLEFPYDVNPKKIFIDENIHKGLAKLNYRNPEIYTKLKNMYNYICNNQCLKEHDLFPIAGIREGIKAQNVEYLSYLMDERRMIPALPNGTVDAETIVMGKSSPNEFVREFFDEEYLLRKTSQRAYYIPSLYNEVPIMRSFTPKEIDAILETPKIKPSLDELANDSFFEEPIYQGNLRHQAETIKKSDDPAAYGISQAELKKSVEKVTKRIQEDEEKHGQVRLRTLNNISADYNFSLIKNKPLNITGSRLVHLIAETPVNPSENSLLNNTFENLIKYHTNFDVLDDFGETALKRAVDAENYPVIHKLLQDCNANPYMAGKDAQSAYIAATQSNNAKLISLFFEKE